MLRKSYIGVMAAVAMLGGAGLSVVGLGNSDLRVEQSKPKAPAEQQTQRQAVLTREEQAEARRERERQRWRGFRYRKDGAQRSAGDRAHKRMKNRRRGGR